MIVRELLAIFGLDYDPKGEKQAEKGIDGLVKQADMLQTAFSSALQAAAISAPFIFLAKLASDAQENMNLLGVVFEENAGEVQDWANEVAGSLGQSRYGVQELAARFGGLVGAMVGPGRQAADMSKQLTALSIDMSSLFRVQLPTAEDALIVLQSALAGETEAIKRFGVDLTVAAQETEALNLGLGKYKDLTKEQKAQVRFNILMRDLAFVQGDAAKTLDQFAGSWEAARNLLRDVGTEIGFFLLPGFESLLKLARGFLEPLAGGAETFREWTKDTNLATAAVMTLVLVVGTLLLPILLKLAPIVAAFAVFVVIMDEVITTLRGGNSVIGEFTKWLDALDKGMPGIGNKILKYLWWPFNRFRDILGAVGVLIAAVFQSIQEGSFTPLKHAAQGIGSSLMGAAQGLIQGTLEGPGAAVAEGAGELRDFLDENLSSVGNIQQYLAQNAPGFLTPTMLEQVAGAPELAQMSPISGGGRTLVFQQGGKQIKFELYQQPGESQEDFAQRVAEIVDQREEDRDLAMANEMIQGGIPEAT